MSTPHGRVTLLALMTFVLPAAVRADDWPQFLGPRRDGVWREQGVMDKFPTGGLTAKWRVPVGAGYSAPAVAGRRVYLTDRQLKAGAQNPRNPFERQKIPGVERVLCLDANDGKVVWKDEYDVGYTVSYAAGPRATPTVADGKVYTVGAEGDVHCYDAQSGHVDWKASLKIGQGAETPLWGFSASPLVDGDLLICVGAVSDVRDANEAVVALDRKSGKVRWTAVASREPGYCPPVVYEHGGKRQLIVWHPQGLVSLDPQTGKEYWSQPFEAENGLSIAMPRLLGDRLLVSSNYEGSRMYRLSPDAPRAGLLWKRGGKGRRKEDQTLYALMSTPFLRGNHAYGVSRDGALCCIDANDGKVVWQTFDATTGDEGPKQWANAFLIAVGEAAPDAEAQRFAIFNETGDLILADLSPKGYREVSRAHVIEPLNTDAQRAVVWSYPAFANRCVFVRNDREIICYPLAAQANEG
jgi:outer membrane protein assembly factor BamB